MVVRVSAGKWGVGMDGIAHFCCRRSVCAIRSLAAGQSQPTTASYWVAVGVPNRWHPLVERSHGTSVSHQPWPWAHLRHRRPQLRQHMLRQLALAHHHPVALHRMNTPPHVCRSQLVLNYEQSHYLRPHP
jgi:hypothetical protein